MEFPSLQGKNLMHFPFKEHTKTSYWQEIEVTNKSINQII